MPAPNDRPNPPGGEWAESPYTSVGVVRAEREFLAAAVAVWREGDRLEGKGSYPGIAPETDLRQRERAAWNRYRDLLDKENADG